MFWKPLQQLEAAAKKFCGKNTFLKCRKILKDYKSERNPLKILKGVVFFGNVVGPQSATLLKNNSTTCVFQLICLPFKNNCLSKKTSKKE